MAEVTTTVHLRVRTFDPAQGTMIPVPGARVLVEDSGWLYDPDLSEGEDVTDADGVVAIALTYDDADAGRLNPFFTVTLPEDGVALPAGAAAERRMTLPEEWETTHYLSRRARALATHTDPASPYEVVVGLPVQLRMSYTDFDPSGERNPFALPARTARVYLADYDDFFCIDWLQPDDTLTGFGFDPVAGRTVAAGEDDDYPYFDTWPTEPCAFEVDAGPDPRAVLDPPGMPVGMLGGGSFTNVGPLAVDGHGFVFMADGNTVRRFYPDGALCETIAMPIDGAVPSIASGLAVDQHRNLFVADAANNRVLIFVLADLEGQSGLYLPRGPFGSAGAGDGQFAFPTGLAVLPNRVVDGPELLAVVDTGNSRVQVFTIALQPLPGNQVLAHRALPAFDVTPAFLTKFGVAGTSAGEFQMPIGIAVDRQRRLFVVDHALHRVSRWSPNATATAYSHDGDWERSGGGPGAGIREFDQPAAVAVDTKNGYVYVADPQNVRVQRLDAESGNHLVDWTASDIFQLDGPMSPVSVAVDARGDVYVADADNVRVVRATPYAADGSVHTDEATPRTLGDPWTPTSSPTHMRVPAYVAYGPDRQLWVADSGNNRVLVYTLADLAPPGDPEVVEGGFSRPAGVAVAADGAAWVVDSGNDRIVPFDTARAAGTAIGATGAGDGQFDDPRGIALVAPEAVQRLAAVEGEGGSDAVSAGMPLLLVADRGNGRVQILQGDGVFVGAITTDGTTAFAAPEDVAVDASGRVFVADSGNSRIVRFRLRRDGTAAFEKAFPVPERLRRPPLPASMTAWPPPRPTGVSIGPDGSLIVTDQEQSMVMRMTVDGALDSYWDLRALLRMRKGTGGALDFFYDPELAHSLLLALPTRAVLDERGVMAIADTGQDRVRVLRAFTDIRATLFDLGEGAPDISVRAVMKREMPEIGLTLNVGDVSIFDESQDFETEPIEDFGGERFERWEVIRAENGSNAAVNVMRVVRIAHSWMRALTRTDDPEFGWGAAENQRTLDVDFIGGSGPSYYFFDVNLYEANAHGRGSDAWNDSTMVHEVTHWIFHKSVRPYLPFSIAGLIELARSHGGRELTSENQALSEGWAEFTETCWGTEYGRVDRVRGTGMRSASDLLTWVVRRGSTDTRFLFGGAAASGLIPTFDAPEQGLECEGYFANALYQIYRALVDPGVVFADSPAYWHRYNAPISEAASARFTSSIWKALRRFEVDPPQGDLDRGAMVYLRNVLAVCRDEQPQFAQIVQSLYELNNLLMPRISITEGTSTTAPGTPLGETVEVAPGATRELIIRVTDASGAPLAGYNLHLTVPDTARYTLVGGATAIRHGRRRPSGGPASTTDLYRATNVNGIVRLQVTAPALPEGTSSLTEDLRVTYQPDFDSDETFDPPGPADDRETTLRKLYLYELRAAAKVWPLDGNNFGAIVSRSLTFEVES